MTDTFTCAICGETFPKARSDEEAWAEQEAIFGEVDHADDCVICEDCWKPGMERMEVAGLIGPEWRER